MEIFNSYFEITEKEWDFAIFFIAENAANDKLLSNEINKMYQFNPLAFFRSASTNRYFNNAVVTSYPLVKEREIVKIMGVLMQAEQDADAQKELKRIVKKLYPKIYNAFDKFSNESIHIYMESIPPITNEAEADSISAKDVLPVYLAKIFFDEKKVEKFAKKPQLEDLKKAALHGRKIDKHELSWAVFKDNLTSKISLFKLNREVVDSFRTNDNFWKGKTITFNDIDNQFTQLPTRPRDFLELSLGLRDKDFLQNQCTHQNQNKLKSFLQEINGENCAFESNHLAKIFILTQLIKVFMEENGLNMDRFFSRPELYKDVNERVKRYAINIDSDSKHRHFDPITYTYFYFINCFLIEYKDLKERFKSTFPEAQYEQVNDLSDKIQSLKERLEYEKMQKAKISCELEIAQAQLSKYQKQERSQIWNREKEFTDKISILEKELAVLKEGQKELINLRAFFFNQQIEEWREDHTGNNLKQELKEITKGKSNITIGGHPQLRKQLKSVFPQFTILDGTLNTQDFSALDNADYVFFFVQNMSHSTYYKAIEQLAKSEVPYAYIDKNNIDLIAKVMINCLNA